MKLFKVIKSHHFSNKYYYFCSIFSRLFIYNKPFLIIPMKKNRHTHKVMWTNEEDEKLINAVHAYGIKNWNVIAEMIEGRSGKQCRDYH